MVPGIRSPGHVWAGGSHSWRIRQVPINMYEGMFLLDSAKASVAWEETVQQVHGILTKHGSEIVASRQWDEKRLAYPVKGHRKGTYLLTFFKADASRLKDISHDCKLNDVILRELILKVHPKLAEASVQQGMSATPTEEEERRSDEEIDERERPRRRSRRDD